jgi:nicotinate-nucleotide adenylyltransferase
MLRKKSAEVHYAFPRGSEHPVWPAQPLPVGVYAGSFDPIHAGHIVFALKAQKLTGLEHVYFMPERRPARQQSPEHYVHRVAMLRGALKPHRQFSVLDLPDARLTSRSLPRLLHALPPQAHIHLLVSASQLLWFTDALPPLYRQMHLVVAVTSQDQMAEVLARFQADAAHVANLTFIDIGSEHISSAAVRSGLRQGKTVRGLLPSVLQYARRQWLYLPLKRS